MIYWPTARRLRIRATPGHLITLQQHTLNPKLPVKPSAGPHVAEGKVERGRGERGGERERAATKQQLSFSCVF